MSKENVEQRLASIRERDRLRAAGKWATWNAGHEWIIQDKSLRTLMSIPEGGSVSPEEDRANAAFIVGASADIPCLLALVDTLSGQLDDVAKSSEGEMARQWERRSIVDLVAEDCGNLIGWACEIMSNGRGRLNEDNRRELGDRLGDMISNIKARGPVPQDAPDVGAARAEVARLRAALREVSSRASDARCYCPAINDIARQALGEDTP